MGCTCTGFERERGDVITVNDDFDASKQASKMTRTFVTPYVILGVSRTDGPARMTTSCRLRAQRVSHIHREYHHRPTYPLSHPDLDGHYVSSGE